MIGLLKPVFFVLALGFFLTPHSASPAPIFQEWGQGSVQLIAAQPFLTNEDFKNPERLEAALAEFMAEAEGEDLLGDQAVVVFPELLGLYFYFMGEAEGIYAAEDLFSAGAAMIKARLLHPLRMWTLLGAPPLYLKGRSTDVGGLLYRKLLSSKAQEVATTYQQVFSALSRRFGVHIVAGSVPLPGPEVSTDGRLTASGRGEMKNVSALFYPSGQMDERLSVKAFPTREEELDLFTAAQEVTDLPAYDLPFGRLAIAICADSWYPQTYEHFQSEGVDFVAVPAYLPGEDAGELVWQGYNFAADISSPEDIDERDIGWLSEWQAWQKYSLPGRLPSSMAGVVSFMKGSLWGSGFYGPTLAVERKEWVSLPSTLDQGTFASLRVAAKKEE